MKPQIKIRYQDSLAKKRRIQKVAKLSIIVAISLATISALIYLIFFTPWLRIDNVLIEVDERKVSSVESRVNEYLDKNWLGLVPVRRNIIFLSKSGLREELIKSFDGLINIEINKDIPHTLRISGENRSAEMIWCFANSCHYLDEEGNLWGVAPESSGFLIPVIKDSRDNQSLKVNSEILLDIENIFSSLAKLKIAIKNIYIKNSVFEEYEITTAYDYSIFLTREFSIDEQLNSLAIFISQNPNIIPKYFDLRIPGRVYYKK